jgi:hypothetical protein
MGKFISGISFLEHELFPWISFPDLFSGLFIGKIFISSLDLIPQLFP